MSSRRRRRGFAKVPIHDAAAAPALPALPHPATAAAAAPAPAATAAARDDPEPHWLPATLDDDEDEDDDDDDFMFSTQSPPPIVDGRSLLRPSPIALPPASTSGDAVVGRKKLVTKAERAEERRQRAAAKAEAKLLSMRKDLVAELGVKSQAWDTLSHLSSTDEEPDGSDGSVQSYSATDEEGVFKTRHMRYRHRSTVRKLKPAELLETSVLDGLVQPTVQVLRPDIAQRLQSHACGILTCVEEADADADAEPRTLVLPCRHVIHVKHLLDPEGSLWPSPADAASRDPAAVSSLPQCCWVCGQLVQDVLTVVYAEGKPVAAFVNDGNLRLSIFTGQSLDTYLPLMRKDTAGRRGKSGRGGRGGRGARGGAGRGKGRKAAPPRKKLRG